MRYIIFIIIISGTTLTSCTINSHVMLKTPKDYKFDTPKNGDINEYIITTDDLVQFQLFANNGFQIIDVSGEQGNNLTFKRANAFSYLVKKDSTARLPILGDIKLAGNSILEAEKLLEKEYEQYYVDPYVQIQVTNKRIILFPGTGSNAQVIKLSNNNTTLLEAIALAGGISKEGKAARIKLIRRFSDHEEIYLIDLSTINGLQYGNMIVQGNDVIYVEPNANLAREALADVAPIVSLLSSSLFIWATLRTIAQ